MPLEVLEKTEVDGKAILMCIAALLTIHSVYPPYSPCILYSRPTHHAFCFVVSLFSHCLQDEADVKVASMEACVEKLDAEKKAADTQAAEATTRAAELETLLEESAAREVTMQAEFATAEAEAKTVSEMAVAEIARLTEEHQGRQTQMENQTSGVAALQLALRTAEQQVARAEEQSTAASNEGTVHALEQIIVLNEGQ
jgi:phage shock protein A